MTLKGVAAAPKTEQWRRWFDGLSPERQAELRRSRTEVQKQRVAAFTAEEREAQNEWARANYAKNVEKRRDQGRLNQRAHRARQTSGERAEDRRRAHLGRYGLTPAAYAVLLDQQGGVCAVCKRPERAVKNGVVVPLAVDHGHRTGIVRGLLCGSCNGGLGLIDDSPERLLAAFAYLARDIGEVAS